MASVSNIISRSGQYEGIVQQLVQLESQKKVQYQTDLRDQNDFLLNYRPNRRRSLSTFSKSYTSMIIL